MAKAQPEASPWGMRKSKWFRTSRLELTRRRYTWQTVCHKYIPKITYSSVPASPAGCAILLHASLHLQTWLHRCMDARHSGDTPRTAATNVTHAKPKGAARLSHFQKLFGSCLEAVLLVAEGCIGGEGPEASLLCAQSTVKLKKKKQVPTIMLLIGSYAATAVH